MISAFAASAVEALDEVTASASDDNGADDDDAMAIAFAIMDPSEEATASLAAGVAAVAGGAITTATGNGAASVGAAAPVLVAAGFGARSCFSPRVRGSDFAFFEVTSGFDVIGGLAVGFETVAADATSASGCSMAANVVAGLPWTGATLVPAAEGAVVATEQDAISAAPCPPAGASVGTDATGQVVSAREPAANELRTSAEAARTAPALFSNSEPAFAPGEAPVAASALAPSRALNVPSAGVPPRTERRSAADAPEVPAEGGVEESSETEESCMHDDHPWRPRANAGKPRRSVARVLWKN